MTSQLRANFQAPQSVHVADDFTTLNYEPGQLSGGSKVDTLIY